MRLYCVSVLQSTLTLLLTRWDPTGSAMSGATMPELNERDEAFLSDLSGTIDIAPVGSPVLSRA